MRTTGARLPLAGLLCCLAALTVGLRAAEARADPTIATVGDIACDPASPFFNGGLGDATRCRQGATGELLDPSRHSLVLPLGDLKYNAGTLANFQASYDPAWGQVKALTAEGACAPARWRAGAWRLSRKGPKRSPWSQLFLNGGSTSGDSAGEIASLTEEGAIAGRQDEPTGQFLGV